ncbi:MAG: YceI family protein [Cyclobacteriaceae bacterium]
MKKSIILVALIFQIMTVYGQAYTLKNTESSCMVSGTSTLHDWHLEATEMSGEASFQLDNGMIAIENLSFDVNVEGLESGKGAMDKNTFKALKSDKYPEIKYEFVRIIDQQQTATGLLLKTGGKLSIAGATKSVYLDVLASNKENVSFSGEITFNMSDYGVEPPVALMGTITTGDEITIAFNVQYSK